MKKQVSQLETELVQLKEIVLKQQSDKESQQNRDRYRKEIFARTEQVRELQRDRDGYNTRYQTARYSERTDERVADRQRRMHQRTGSTHTGPEGQRQHNAEPETTAVLPQASKSTNTEDPHSDQQRLTNSFTFISTYSTSSQTAPSSQPTLTEPNTHEENKTNRQYSENPEKAKIVLLMVNSLTRKISSQNTKQLNFNYPKRKKTSQQKASWFTKSHPNPQRSK